jgi:sugar phosphate isomerase/epimerase
VLSITTDYVQDHGSPEPYLRRIAEAGFSHLHWCHHWRTDFVYSDPEIDQIAKWMHDYGLKMCDVHASAGVEKSWISTLEYERLAGVELVKNRIKMAARLSSDVIIMHVPAEPQDPQENSLFWTQLGMSLDALEPYSRDHGVRIAIENLFPDNFGTLEKIMSRYAADYVGICYDSGHANITGIGLDPLDRLKDRLISVHLHDNDTTGDQHKLIFAGTVDWDRLARIMAQSAYTKPVSMELSIHHFGVRDESAFLKAAFETGTAFARMIDEHRT